MIVDELTVALGERAYPVVFGAIAEWAPKLGAMLAGRSVLIVTDDHVARLHGGALRTQLAAAGMPESAMLALPPGEEHKNFAAVEQICRECARQGLDRHSVLIAFSGGVPGDLTGFAAAIYMRGIDFVQIPTTLLAAVDSSVGGKTGADLPEGKNLIGAFHQPRMVLIDPALLTTLPPAEWRNGLAEVVKYGMILDAGFLAELERNAAQLHPDQPELTGRIIRRSCECKAAVVAGDERETGRRAILNYGHTVGHAVEKLSAFRIPHGEAVAIGMAAAARLAVALNFCPAEVETRQNALLTALGLPIAVPGTMTPEAVIAAMRSDKKNRNGAITMILPRRAGAVEIVRGVDETMLAAVLRELRR